MVKKCKYCGLEKEYEKHIFFASHVSNCKSNPNFYNKHLKGKETVKRKTIERLGKFKKFEVSCHKCFKKFEVEEREKLFPQKEKYFCSISCSNKFRTISKETREKIRIGIREYNHDTKYPCSKINYFTCVICNNLFINKRKRKTCSDKCLKILNIENGKLSGKIGGKISASKRVKRSKNEIFFANLCKKQFQNVLTNEPIFNGWDADIILQDLKIAILWNGRWHYEKITEKHSVKQVQNRDRIKIEEIKKCGYTPYIIKDLSHSKKRIKFVIKEFLKFNEFLNKIGVLS